MQKESDSEIDQEVVFLSEDLKNKNKEGRNTKENEDFGVEAKAAVDSRIYERTSTFLGLFLFIVAFGGIGSKYESVFSIEYEGKMVVVLYHGLCLVSAGDSLLIRGKWYQGKKLGIQGKVVVAEGLKTWVLGSFLVKNELSQFAGFFLGHTFCSFMKWRRFLASC